MNFKQCIVLIPLLMATVVVQSWSRTICRAAWPASGDSSCVGKLSLNLQMKTAKTRRICPANRYETTPQGAPSTTPKIHVMMKLQGDHPDVVVDSLRRSGITVYGRLGNIVTASLSESRVWLPITASKASPLEAESNWLQTSRACCAMLTKCYRPRQATKPVCHEPLPVRE